RSHLQMAHIRKGPLSEGFDLEAYREGSFTGSDNWSPNAAEVPGPWSSHAVFILPTTISFSFHSESSVSPNSLSWTPPRKYFGTLRAGQPSGFMALQLADATPDLCTVILRIDQPKLPKSARLELRQTTYNGDVYFPTIGEFAKSKLGYIDLTIGDLMPGNYIFALTLPNAGLVQLIDKQIELELPAGTTEVRDLSTSVWSLLRVNAITTHRVPPESLARIELQPTGESEWQPFITHSREAYPGGSRTRRGTAVQVGGPAGLSDALPPGQYRLRASLPGHATQERTVTLAPGETKPVTFALRTE
ncbi:MAG: carboxypeptidase-like regulatory domain-containing protein, partial [Planctomycetota bacterium]|nr:carboxypeptidase-like regulatory domain-containing protein [Planctomycetota bacterium]